MSRVGELASVDTRLTRADMNDKKSEGIPQGSQLVGIARDGAVLMLVSVLCGMPFQVLAAPLPGGSLDPLSIPKYVTPLFIPPVMKQLVTETTSGSDNYAIAVRQFKQQILPVPFPATTVWGYGPESDPTPSIAPDAQSQFNYPAYTIETSAHRPVRIRWINGLVDEAGDYRPHLLPIDQTLHWANPPRDCLRGEARTDCMGKNPAPYRGPMPMVPHVHGAHVDPHSDGYPEAWWLPDAKNIPATVARSGRLFDDATGSNHGDRGYADFSYRNDQSATALWYHDHTLGMTRANIYAGPAGFWLIRGGDYDGSHTVSGGTQVKAVLPGPAPIAGQGLLELNGAGSKVRNAIREIPLVIQDRSFNQDGSLYYPANRAFFEKLSSDQMQIPFAPDSDMAPIWNPEAFFNVMVVNGASWPKLDVAKAGYRFRLLNGSSSRFLNLALFAVDPATGKIDPKKEIPFYQIGADQGFLPKVVRIKTGEQVALTPGSSEPASKPNHANQRALLIAPSERADVIVDFSSLPDGTIIRMVNTAPDAPFGGFPADQSDPDTTGQIMQFVVMQSLTSIEGTTDGQTSRPSDLRLHREKKLTVPAITRVVSLNEASSSTVCVRVGSDGNPLLDHGQLVPIPGVPSGQKFLTACEKSKGAPFGPSAAKLGTVIRSKSGARGNPLSWSDATGAGRVVSIDSSKNAMNTVTVTESPRLNTVEEWQIYNFTEDAHPIHVHLVRFEVVTRTAFNGASSKQTARSPGESGYKDTVIAYPGEITTLRARFDRPGLYVWHCHILEHEDNEMMRPFVVMENPPPKP
jgi:spore coat protein A, manganese oxidase